ncbi:5477_t:CDS:1, partial [Dentiscutata erythropus]
IIEFKFLFEVPKSFEFKFEVYISLADVLSPLNDNGYLSSDDEIEAEFIKTSKQIDSRTYTINLNGERKAIIFIGCSL